MDRSSSIRQHHAASACSGLRRARVSIDLRAHGAALAAIARSRQVPLAVVVRTALAEWLTSRASAEATAADTSPILVAMLGGSLVKVTLRMPDLSAARLARAARVAEVSQGFYVAQLVEGQPPRPVSRDLREGRRALLNSTTQLAPLCGALRALERGLRGPGADLAACKAAIDPLQDAVHRHLAVASSLLAEVAGPRRSPVRGSGSA